MPLAAPLVLPVVPPSTRCTNAFSPAYNQYPGCQNPDDTLLSALTHQPKIPHLGHRCVGATILKWWSPTIAIVLPCEGAVLCDRSGV